MVKRSKKLSLTSLGNLDFFEDLGPAFDQSPFKKALSRYFSDAPTSQKDLKAEMKRLRSALRAMDEAKVAHDVMQESRKRLQAAYQELLEKSKA